MKLHSFARVLNFLFYFSGIGFDMVFIETVGLGQNELEIDNVADFVVYVIPPGSGDDLQGSKKGIMEIADMIAVNKYDGQFEQACKKLKVIEIYLVLD
jgi:LAO/AO transport system kinase